MLSQTVLSANILKSMIKRNKRSAIISLSSFGSLYPVGLYSATKVFNDYFSRSLTQEYKDKIDSISLRPRVVTTPMSG